MCDLLINIIGTIIGGLVLTLILFLLNEYIFPKANLTGEWDASVKTERSSFNPYIGLIIEYKIHLLQKGYELIGSGEKIKDINQNGIETVFEREKRVLIKIEGYYERKYFSESKVYLNVHEDGRLRETRATYSLILNTEKKLTGHFISTAADSSGSVEMNKS